jgi:hypothetical protein
VDHKKLFEINLYICLSILPLIFYHVPSPKAVMHPQTIIDPPPCFTVWWTCWGPTQSQSPIQHHDLPFELNLFIFVLSLKITRFQSSMVQSSYLWANIMCVRTCLQLRNGFLWCTCAPISTSLTKHVLVMPDNNLHVSDQTCFTIADALPSQPSIPRATQCFFSRSARR